MKYFVVVFLLFLSAVGRSEVKIVDPNELTDEAFRGVGLLLGSDNAYCVGVAIDRSKVLTSAACLTGLKSPVKFWANAYEQIPWFEVREIRVHPGFNPANPNTSVNAAIAVLKEDVDALWYPSPLRTILPPRAQGLAVSYDDGVFNNETGRLIFSRPLCLSSNKKDCPCSDGYEFVRRMDRPTQMVCQTDIGSPIYAYGRLAGVLIGVTMSPGGVGCDGVVAAQYVSYAKVKPWIDSTVP